KFSNINEITEAKNKSEQLANELAELIALLKSDDSTKSLTDRRKEIEEILRKIGKAIRDQKVTQAQTQIGKADPKDLENSQKGVTDTIKDINKALGPQKGGQGSEAKIAKGEAKSEGKGDGQKGEGKAGDAKGGESKGGESQAGQSKHGEAKEGGKEGNKAG